MRSMGRKPAPGLPDVFAKPGGAPARGTSIEDLPKAIEEPTWPEPPAWQPTVDSIAAETTSAPPPRAPTAPAYPLATTPVAASAKRSALGGVPVVIWVLLIISLTAPLWEGSVLPALGIHSPGERAAARSIAAVAQQDVRLTVLEQRLAAATAQLDAVRQQVATGTRDAAEAATQARAVAMLRLADRLHGSSPFIAELTVLRTTGGDAGALQPILTLLVPYAASGVPSLDQLQRELQSLNDAVTHAVRQANPGSWKDIINWTGLNGAQPPAAIDPSLRAIRQAQIRLGTGDITGAIEQAGQVEDIYQAEVADWVIEAKARIAADAALRQIDAMIAHPPPHGL
jgi:hypothetical protein